MDKLFRVTIELVVEARSTTHALEVVELWLEDHTKDNGRVIGDDIKLPIEEIGRIPQRR